MLNQLNLIKEKMNLKFDERNEIKFYFITTPNKKKLDYEYT